MGRCPSYIRNGRWGPGIPAAAEFPSGLQTAVPALNLIYRSWSFTSKHSPSRSVWLAPGLSLPLQCPQALVHIFKFGSPGAGRNSAHAAWQVENGGGFLSLPPLIIFFSSLKLSSPKRQEGRQPSAAEAGDGGKDSPRHGDHQFGPSFLSCRSSFPGHRGGRPMAQEGTVGRRGQGEFPTKRGGASPGAEQGTCP